jgi:protein tyrosine/serine phosphatase
MPSSRGVQSTSTRSKKTTASEIAPGIFVGGWNDAAAFDGVRICVLDDAPAEPIPGSTHVPIYDEKREAALPANLDAVVALVDAAREHDSPVLLFCGHGIRRGSLAGAWYLHRHDGVDLETAYRRVRAVRPKIEEGQEWIAHWPPEPAAKPRRA